MQQTQAIWLEFKDRLFGFIKTKVNNVTDAEDILQEIFIKIHLKKASIKEESKLTSWIYQITRNSIIDYYKTKKTTVNEDNLPENFENESNNLNQGFIKCMVPFIKELSPLYQDAIQEVSLKGISQKEYAIANKISYSAAKSRVQRARFQLKNLVYDCCGLESDLYGNIISSNNDNCDC